MTCTGSAGTEDAAISLSAAYLTTDGVATVSVEASPSVAGGSIGDTQLGIRVLGPIAELTGGSAGSDWLVEKIDDETCDHGCFETFEDVKFEFYTAPDGSRSLHVTPTAMP